jgi:D-glycerate 3-kinase
MLEIVKDFIIKNLNSSSKPLVVGICGPQGCGKSFLCSSLVKELEGSLSISIDDFYLTHNEQLELSSKDNYLLKYRGLPKTHDVNLGESILFQLLNADKEFKKTGIKTTVHIPRYNKSLFEGEGDREARENWSAVEPPFNVILLEGWMLGFKRLKSIDNDVFLDEKIYKKQDLAEINAALPEYEKWTKYINIMVTIFPIPSYSIVYDWRHQQEVQDNKNALNQVKLKDFISRFMVMYKLYTPELRHYYKHSPQLLIEIDENRKVLKFYEK